MDLFTHILVAYLITFGIVGFQPSYLAAGALAGGLPDADALFYPISRRFPILRHHGITHSIFGVTVIAIAGGLVAPLIVPGSGLIYFVVMEAGGLAHVGQDAFTNFSVPPLLPFSDRRLSLDADRAVNFATMIVSVLSFYLLLGVERNRVPFGEYLLTVYALTVFFVLYFAVRLAARVHIGRRLKSLGDFDVVIPSSNPFEWTILSERRSAGRIRTNYAKYVFGRGIVRGPFAADVPLEPTPGDTGPIRSATEALERSYPLARRASRLLDDTYHFGEAHDAGPEGWVATWYSLEFTAFGRAAGVRVRFPPSGEPPIVRASWNVPPWRRRAHQPS